jgi:hypothetical protein
LCSSFCLVLLFAGCGGGNANSNTQSGSTSSGHTAPLINGNWDIQANSSAYPGVSTHLGGYIGGDNSGSDQVNGYLVVIQSGSTCYSSLTGFPVSGSLDGKGGLTLTSNSVSNQTIKVSGKLNSTGSALQNATYTITATNPSASSCAAGDSGTVSGQQVQPLDGAYSGTITSASGVSLKATAQLTQDLVVSSDTNGTLQESGVLSFQNSPCFASASTPTDRTIAGVHPLGGLVMGNTVAAYFVAQGVPSTVVVVGTFDSAAKSIQVNYAVVGGTCDGDYGSGMLTKS